MKVGKVDVGFIEETLKVLSAYSYLEVKIVYLEDDKELYSEVEGMDYGTLLLDYMQDDVIDYELLHERLKIHAHTTLESFKDCLYGVTVDERLEITVTDKENSRVLHITGANNPIWETPFVENVE